MSTKKCSSVLKYRDPTTHRCRYRQSSRVRNVLMKRPCSEGKHRNPPTGRCIKNKSRSKTKKTTKPCQTDEKYRDPETGRCVYWQTRKVRSLLEKPCSKAKIYSGNRIVDKIPRIRNSRTGRCIQTRPRRVLSQKMLQEIVDVLDGKDNDIVIEKFNIKIKTEDLLTLTGDNWLNDEIINFYFSLIQERNPLHVHCFNSFFYNTLKNSGYEGVRRWTRKFDLFEKKVILIPIHVRANHWCCAVIKLNEKKIKYYDSLGGHNQRCLRLLKKYVQDESKDKNGEEFDFTDWELVTPQNITKQTNGFDCGVFTCLFANYEAKNKGFDFQQNDIPYFRQRIIYEIIHGKLLR